MNYHFYADDLQLYISFKRCCTNSTNDGDRGKTSTKLNQDKTKVWFLPLVIFQDQTSVMWWLTVPPLQRTLVSLSIMALSMVPHITVVRKSAGFFSPA